MLIYVAVFFAVLSCFFPFFFVACLFVCLLACLFVFLFVCLFVRLFVCLSVCLSVCLFVCLFDAVVAFVVVAVVFNGHVLFCRQGANQIGHLKCDACFLLRDLRTKWFESWPYCIAVHSLPEITEGFWDVGWFHDSIINHKPCGQATSSSLNFKLSIHSARGSSDAATIAAANSMHLATSPRPAMPLARWCSWSSALSEEISWCFVALEPKECNRMPRLVGMVMPRGESARR